MREGPLNSLPVWHEQRLNFQDQVLSMLIWGGLAKISS